MTTSSWQWDEMVQQGTDYDALPEVRRYDEHMADWRDVTKEADRILHFLCLAPGDVVLEVGTGTGYLARRAAGICRLVIAVDVSRAMLTYAKEKADEEGVGNVTFQEAGFLTYAHEGEPLAAVVSQLALHHLPDPWKLLGLSRLAGFMRPGGRLFLTDVVLPDTVADDPEQYFAHLIAQMPPAFQEPMARHLRREFSTFDWAMRAILDRAGFVIEEADMDEGFLAHYLCRRA